MPRSLLPPNGIYIPIGIVFDLELTAPMFRTWCQLRSMAWGKKETPPFTIDQLAVLTGNKHSTIYGHMAALRHRDALRWRTADRGTLIVSFPEQVPPELDADQPVNQDSVVADFQNTGINSPDSRKLEMPNPSSSSDPQEDSSSSLSADESLSKDRESLEEEGGAIFQNSGNDFQISGIDRVQKSGIQDSGKVPDIEGLQDSRNAVPVQLYHSIAGYTPNAVQRRRIIALVTDMQVWKDSLYHWLAHGWNPRNLTGMLELYSRGGTEGCRVCNRAVPKGDGRQSPGNQALAYLDELSKEWSDGGA
jgi:hypothetical protein